MIFHIKIFNISVWCYRYVKDKKIKNKNKTKEKLSFCCCWWCRWISHTQLTHVWCFSFCSPSLVMLLLVCDLLWKILAHINFSNLTSILLRCSVIILKFCHYENGLFQLSSYTSNVSDHIFLIIKFVLS